LFGSAPQKQPFALQALNNVGGGTAIDASALDKPCLAEALICRHGEQHCELARRQAIVPHPLRKYFGGCLCSPMKQMDWRPVETTRILGQLVTPIHQYL
jgi:hypothetical protein